MDKVIRVMYQIRKYPKPAYPEHYEMVFLPRTPLPVEGDHIEFEEREYKVVTRKWRGLDLISVLIVLEPA